MMPSADDRRWMRRALAEARRGEGATRPNPPVGAVVVRGGKLLAAGHHRAAGQPHAEVEALEACAEDPAGATLYVTLEPCSTQGRTPPCTGRILASKVARVVVGTPDPNPRHAGRGIEVLRQAGIPVDLGVLDTDAQELIAPFARWISTGRSFVTLKMAQSLDGAIADCEGRSQWITGPRARTQVQRLRRAADAVMVGAGTILADDPSLLCRLPNARDHLFRIVLDSRGRIPPSARVLADGNARRTVIATTEACPSAVREAWQAAGGSVWTLPHDARGRVSLEALLVRTAREGWLHILCEGGATLAGSLAAAHRVDTLQLFIAPVVFGARSANSFGDLRFPLATAPRYHIIRQRLLDDDLWITALPRLPAS